MIVEDTDGACLTSGTWSQWNTHSQTPVLIIPLVLTGSWCPKGRDHSRKFLLALSLRRSAEAVPSHHQGFLAPILVLQYRYLGFRNRTKLILE